MSKAGIEIVKLGNRERLFRAASLVSIGLGSAIFGAGANLLAYLDIQVGISVFAAVCAATFGLTLGGQIGMVLFALGATVLGSAFFGGAIPTWLFALGLPILVPGLAYRIFFPE